MVTEKVYIESATSLEEKLARYDTIILALENRMIDAGTDNATTGSYSVDDGQVKIQNMYTSVDAMEKGIEAFEYLRNKILNKLNGRQMVLRPWRGQF